MEHAEMIDFIIARVSEKLENTVDVRKRISIGYSVWFRALLAMGTAIAPPPPGEVEAPAQQSAAAPNDQDAGAMIAEQSPELGLTGSSDAGGMA